MKFFLGVAILLTMTGCSSEIEKSLKKSLSQARETNEVLQEQLNTCQAKLDFGGGNKGSEQSQSEPVVEEPSQPQYEEVQYVEVDGVKCYDRSNPEEIPACGMSFWECSDGVVRHCMVNIKYKVKTEQRRIEE